MKCFNKNMLIVLLWAIVTVQVSFSGEGSSAGGDGLICFKSMSSRNAVASIMEQNRKTVLDEDPFKNPEDLKDIKTVRLLDLYLAELNPSYEIDSKEFNSVKESIEYYLQKMRKKSSFAIEIQEAREVLEKGGWIPNNGAVLEIDDSLHPVVFPENCLLVQIASQSKLSNNLSKVYYDRRIIKKMPVKDQTALYFHEWIYQIALSNNQNDSKGVQDVVSFLFSENFSSHSQPEVKDRIIDSGVRPEVYKDNRLYFPKSKSIWGKEYEIIDIWEIKNLKSRYYFVNSAQELELIDQKIKVMPKILRYNNDYDSHSSFGDEWNYFELSEDIEVKIFNQSITLTNMIVLKRFFLEEVYTRSIFKGHLKGNIEINGLPIYKTVEFHGKKGVKSLLRTNLYKDIKIQSNIIKKDSVVDITKDSALYYFSDDIKIFKTGNDTSIPCMRLASFFSTNKLKKCVLAYTVLINGNEYKKDSIITFYPTGEVKYGSINGYYNYKNISFLAGVHFYKNGNLKAGELKENTVIDGVPCRKSDPRNDYVKFNQSGKLIYCNVSKKTKIKMVMAQKQELTFLLGSYFHYVYELDPNSLIFSNGCVVKNKIDNSEEYEPVLYQKILWGHNKKNNCVQIAFHTNGKIRRSKLAKDTFIDGIEYASGGFIEFDSKGVLLQGGLSQDTIFGNIIYKNNTKIYFHKNKKVNLGILANKTVIQGVEYKKLSKISFDKEGLLIYGDLNKDTTIKNISYAKGSTIYFHNNNQVSFGTLAKSLIHNNKFYPKGTSIWLDKNGNIIKLEIIKE